MKTILRLLEWPELSGRQKRCLPWQGSGITSSPTLLAASMFILLTVAATLFSGSACQAEPGQFAGTWTPISYSFVGEEKPASFLEHTNLKLAEDGSGVSTVNGMQQQGTWEVHGKVLTFNLTMGDRQIPVEYIIDGNKLKIDNAVTKAVFLKK